jgi:hypothetical protein
LVRRHILIGDGKTTERKTAKPVFLQFLLVSTLSVWLLSFLGWHTAEHIADGPEESPMHESVEIENKALVLDEKNHACYRAGWAHVKINVSSSTN